jgi:hypothetical protein
LFGTGAIADYPGPPGRFGFIEFFGWWAICLASASLSTKALGKMGKKGRYRYLSPLLAVAIPAIVTALLWWDMRPQTSDGIKNFVEYGQQAVGLTAIAALAVWFAWKHCARKRPGPHQKI